MFCWKTASLNLFCFKAFRCNQGLVWSYLASLYLFANSGTAIHHDTSFGKGWCHTSIIAERESLLRKCPLSFSFSFLSLSLKRAPPQARDALFPPWYHSPSGCVHHKHAVFIFPYRCFLKCLFVFILCMCSAHSHSKMSRVSWQEQGRAICDATTRGDKSLIPSSVTGMM